MRWVFVSKLCELYKLGFGGVYRDTPVGTHIIDGIRWILDMICGQLA
jgi:hypothetical protein